MSYVQSIKTGVKKEHNGKSFLFLQGRKFQNNEQAKTSHEIFFQYDFYQDSQSTFVASNQQ